MTTRYVEVVTDQLAAQIAPEIAITLIGNGWRAESSLGRLVIAASKNTLELNGGDIFSCETAAAAAT